MANIRPFRAYRPNPQVAAQVASVPYDVVDRDEAAALAAANPLSFLHVSRAEIDLPADVNPYSDAVYNKAQSNYEQLISGGHLVRDEQPQLYVYRLKMGEHVQTGVAAAYSVDEYDTDLIKKHEKTRKEKEDDRTRHICQLRAQTGPVFLTYRGQASIDAIVEAVTQGEPLYDLVAPDGISHTLWKVSDSAALVEAFKSVPELYIADGHHRAASASRARAQLREQAGASWSGQEDGNFFLAVSFPADQLRILPYNRVVIDLAGVATEQFLDKLKGVCGVTEGAEPSPSHKGHVSMYLGGGKWYGLTLAKPSGGSPASQLDAAVLQATVLEPLLNIDDPRTSKRIDFVGGIRGTGELVKLVESGRFQVAFSMYPTSLDELMAISDAGEIMPPKSTWFEPKLRDALLIHGI